MILRRVLRFEMPSNATNHISVFISQERSPLISSIDNLCESITALARYMASVVESKCESKRTYIEYDDTHNQASNLSNTRLSPSHGHCSMVGIKWTGRERKLIDAHMLRNWSAKESSSFSFSNQTSQHRLTSRLTSALIVGHMRSDLKRGQKDLCSLHSIDQSMQGDFLSHVTRCLVVDQF